MKIIIEDKKKKELFVSLFALLKGSSSQINACFDTGNLHIQGMDKSHVCLYDLTLKSAWFTAYSVTTKENISFDSNIFYTIISTKCDDQPLTIDREYGSDTMNISFVSSATKKGDYNKYFKMPLLEYDYEEMGIPETEYDAEMILSAKKIGDILSQLANFGDDINIKCSQDYVDFRAEGQKGEMRVNISVDDMTSYAVIEDGDVNLTYSLVYVSKMCLSNKLSNDIEFCLSNECPMKITYNLEDESVLVFYIAPKMAD